MFNILLLLSVSFLASYISTPIIISLSRRLNLLDNPDRRKMHEEAVPRLGGIAIYFGFLVAAVLMAFVLPDVFGISFMHIRVFFYCMAAIVALGVYDDVRGLSPVFKVSIEIMLALAIYISGLRVNIISSPFGGHINLWIFALPVTVLWIIGITNAVNLIDGLDGLATGIGLIIVSSISLIAYRLGNTTIFYLSIALAGSLLGFLRYNFNPARIFMGDSGSLFLGFALSVMSIEGSHKGSTAVSMGIPIILLAIPIIDTFLAIIRRYIRGDSSSRIERLKAVFSADKEHIHHKLIKKGFSHRQSVLTLYGLSLFFGIAAYVSTYLKSSHVPYLFILLITVVILVFRWLGYDDIERKIAGIFSAISKKKL